MDSLLSPGRLPVEVFQEIFFRCLPEPSNDSTHPVSWHRETLSSPENAPLLLCHVCRQWRDIALSSPNLWTTMSVNVRLGVAVPAPDLVSVWLSRSGALPLNLALYQQNESIANRIVAGQILDIFKRYTSQWGDVRFELFGPRYDRLLSTGERAGPLLKRFRLYTSHLFSKQEEKDLFAIFDHVPQLRSLHVSRIPDLDLSAGSPTPIPWQQLAHLTLEYVPAVGTALRILDMCPNLESCNMKIDTVRGSLLYDPPHLSKLRTLSINLGFESLACFLDQLIVPRLTNLTVFVRGPLEQYGWAQEQFGAFLTQSNCHISRLEIHDTGMSSSEFAACLRHPSLQTLIELVIDDTRDWTWDPFVTYEALDLLTVPSFHGRRRMHDHVGAIPHSKLYFLPFLERLTVRGNCFLSQDGTIADMVESRWKYDSEEVVRLKLVEVELPASHMEDMRRLKELQGEGLEVVLTQQY
ncbi:hypothetical protein P691DRAFT_657417 [Macrolepiota fuliginosa MF-IS2]|uniref:F-box domain-containing protein n=1 Tax=Macrolepiota fuliginosa MF-IS2 TaxID=1400762 RepID=A0A9P5XNX9_9AGAR|nr:hypothetical protein P691DRAFT_657417 [Macrolepiota fuliginosa MF-IS2]